MFVIPPRKAPRADRSLAVDGAFDYGEDMDYLRHNSLPKFLRGSSIPGVAGAEGGDKVEGDDNESNSVDDDDDGGRDKYQNADNEDAIDIERDAQSDIREGNEAEKMVNHSSANAKPKQPSPDAANQDITRVSSRKRVSAFLLH